MWRLVRDKNYFRKGTVGRSAFNVENDRPEVSRIILFSNELYINSFMFATIVTNKNVHSPHIKDTLKSS